MIGSSLNYDFCPQFNDYVYWLKKPFGWVICGALFSALVGWLIGPQGFVLMWSFIALLIIGSVWPWLGMKGLDCSLRFKTSRTHEGEPLLAILEVKNRWPIPMFGLMVEGEFLQDIIDEDDKIAVGLQRIPGWSVCQFEWSFNPQRRGKLPIELPLIANGFPFGIYRAEKSVDVNEQTIVWPKRHALQGQPSLDGQQFNIEGLMSDRFGQDGEVIGVRNYRQGDSLRNIHWQKTASGGQLIVKERQICAQKPIRIILDLTPKTHRGQGSQSSYEWAIRAAGNMCQQLHRGHSHIEVICVGIPDEFTSRSSNRNGMPGLLDFFAMLPQQSQIDSSNVDAATIQLSNDGIQTYVIATSDSSLLKSKTSWATSIVLSVDGFSANNGHSQRSSDQPATIQSDDTTIWLNSPSSAASDLSAGWEGSCEHAV